MAILRFFLFLFCCLGSTLAWAQVEAGKVLFARGVVSAVDEQDARRGLRAGATVFEGERIITGRGAITQIHLSDGALLGLRGSSSYLIERQRFDEEEGLAEQAGELLSGWMRMITGAIGKSRPDNVRISTSVATIGIRGTVFQLLHVPEQGLEGFNDVEPGSYVMLEDGSVDFFNAAGSRHVRAGDVAFVGLGQQQPQPRPERRELFSRKLQAALAAGSDTRRLRIQRFLREQASELSNPLASQLDREILAATFVNVGAIGTFWPSRDAVRFSGPANLKYATLDNTRILTGMRAPDDSVGLDILEAQPGSAPVAVGQALLGGAASQVHWGIWREGSFVALDDTLSPYAQTGDWHYVMASNIQTDPSLLLSRLNGVFRYSYVGGTPLVNNAIGGLGTDGAVGRVLGGQMEVDFGTGDLQAQLGLALPNQSSAVGVSGVGSLDDYYGPGLSMTDGVDVNAALRGAFVGPNAEGAVGALLVNDIGNNANYQGVVVFERTGVSGTSGEVVPVLP